MTTPTDLVLVRLGSHRANQRLRRLLGIDRLDARCTLADGGVFALIPADRLDEARRIPGVTKAKPKGEVRYCW